MSFEQNEISTLKVFEVALHFACMMRGFSSSVGPRGVLTLGSYSKKGTFDKTAPRLSSIICQAIECFSATVFYLIKLLLKNNKRSCSASAYKK